MLFNIKTDYSLLHSSLRVKDLVKKSKEYGYQFLGVCELNNMFSAIEFYEACRTNEIKPIIGTTLNIEVDNNIHQIIVIAKNFNGYKNLMYLSSLSYIEYMRGDTSLISLEEVAKQDDLVVILPMLESEIGFHLSIFNEDRVLKGAKGYDAAKSRLNVYKSLFNELYLEIRRDAIEESYIEKELIELSQEFNIPILASSKVEYLNKEDFFYKDALECIEDNKQYDDFYNRELILGDYYLKTKEEFLEKFKNLKEGIDNLMTLFNSIDIEIPLGNPTPPTFKFTKEYATKENLDITDDVEYFKYQCKKGLEERLKLIPKNEHQKYIDRLNYEIDIITNMKFPGYMLIVWDFVREAKQRAIPVGPGRGSAAGSLVAYALKITNIDPLKYGLLFERFLNPERVSMPDIDMDFCQERRGEIIDYVQNKYGKNNVAQVITFGSLLAKGVLRDVARILGIDYADADKFVKLIPDKLGITLKEAKELEPKIEEIINSDALYERLYLFAEKLEGLKRNTGTHAAGVVISDNPLWEKTPLFRQSSSDNMYITQYSLNYLEPVDLIKFDFLGLKTLTVIDKAIKNIKLNRDKNIDIDNLDLEDEEVYKLIQSGKTLGLFQIESEGMQDLAKRLKPSTFEDIIAMLALYRPGPMDAGMLDDYIERKHGRKEISYFFDEFEEVLKPILEPTYGVIVYQEQVMQIVQAIGGFSLGEADIIRRAMGKKKLDLMKKYAEEFATRAKERGFSYENAKALFELIEKFAGYGFNKSHSAAYALITYQTSYLKRYYPTEFLSALLTYEADNNEKVARYIEEAKSLGIEILAPDIFESNLEFTPKGDKILFGLSAIKGVGNKAIESIISNRPFNTLFDFIEKVDFSKVNKRVLEQLIKAGAMDKFGYSRRALLENIDYILDTKRKLDKILLNNGANLFDSEDFIKEDIQRIKREFVIENKEEFDLKTLLDYEYETLNFFVSAHPLDMYRDVISSIEHNKTIEAEELLNQEALFIGRVDSLKVKISKKGNKFAILTFMDLYGKIDMMLFERDLEKLTTIEDDLIAIKAYIEKDLVKDSIRVTCRKILTIEEAKVERAAVKDEVVLLTREVGDEFEKELLSIYKEITKNPGNKRVSLLLITSFGEFKVDTNLRTSLER